MSEFLPPTLLDRVICFIVVACIYMDRKGGKWGYEAICLRRESGVPAL